LIRTLQALVGCPCEIMDHNLGGRVIVAVLHQGPVLIRFPMWFRILVSVLVSANGL